jgi:regulator of protease activity HflC (stomatin/prohibitin superfamily)
LFYLFLTGIVIFAVAVFAAFIVGRALPAVVGVFALVVCWVSSSVGTVDTKNVGVVTSFKKPTGEVKDAGPYFKAPWKDVTDMSLAWQTKSYTVKVQLVGGATADLEVYPRWRMLPNAAPDLFQNYKNFDGVVDSLFVPELRDSANKLFGTYNPLNNVDPKTGQLLKSKDAWATELQADMLARPSLKDKIEFERVTIPTINPDEKTQGKLNEIVAEFAKGKILDQQQVNAQKEKTISETQAKIDPKLFCMRENSKNGLDSGTCLGGNSIIVDSRKN